MSEDLKRLNIVFKDKLEQYKSRLTPKELKNLSDVEPLLYYFFMWGFIEGSGNTQIAV